MNILMQNKYFYRKGGAETYFFSLIEMLENAGCSVIPFSMKHSENLPSEYSRYFIDSIDYYSGTRLENIKNGIKIIYSFEAKRNIEKLIKNTSPDICHLNNFHHQMSPSILDGIKKFSLPVVYTAHDLKLLCPNYKMYRQEQLCEECKNRKYMQCFQHKCVMDSSSKSLLNALESGLSKKRRSHDKIDMIICPSKFFYDKFIEFGYNENRLRYIPNFIDADAVEPCYENDGYCLYFGRLSFEKGVSSLIRAFEKLPDVPLLIIGDGPQRQELELYVNEKNLKNISFLGYKPKEELNKLISRCSLSIIPSVVYENSPLAVLESMSFGKAVLGADIGGIPELIEKGVTGDIFESGNSSDIAEKVAKYIGDDTKLKEMGKRGRARVSDNFSRDKYLHELMTVYDEVIKRA